MLLYCFHIYNHVFVFITILLCIGFIGRKLCPSLIFVNPNFEKYKIVSNQIKDIISEYDPYYASHSLDEVYFDLKDSSLKRYLNETSISNNDDEVNIIVLFGSTT